ALGGRVGGGRRGGGGLGGRARLRQIFGAGTAPAQRIPARVGRDGEDPGADRGARLIAPAPAHDGQKRRLQQVLGQRRVPHHADQKGHHGARVAGVERLEGGLLAVT